MRKPQPLGDTERLVDELLFAIDARLAPHQGLNEALARLIRAVKHQAFEDGQPRKTTSDLEGAHQAPARNLIRPHAVDACSLEPDFAARHRKHAGNAIEERRLAGTVRPDHADDTAFGDGQVDAGQGVHPAKVSRYSADFQHFNLIEENRTDPSDVVASSREVSIVV